MADKLAALFAKADKKKADKAKGGLSTFTNALSGETNFEAQTVKISMSAGKAAAPAELATEAEAPVDIGRDTRSAEWSTAKAPIFTEKEQPEKKPAVFRARGKATGIDNIKWQQLGAETPSPVSPPTASPTVPAPVPAPAAPEGPKKFVARGKSGATGAVAAGERKDIVAAQPPARPATTANTLEAKMASLEVTQAVPEAAPKAEEGPKKFVARGRTGATGALAASEVKPVVSPAPVVQEAAQPAPEPVKPGRYVPPSRR